MWNKLTQVAGLGRVASDSTVSGSPIDVSEMEEQLVQQDSEIQNLKVIVRENEKLLQEKNTELEEVILKFQKFKLQSKAKICQLTNQLKELEKSTKKNDGDFEDTSSSASSYQSKRGKVIVLKKQLEQARHRAEEKEREIEEINKNFEAVIKDLHTQLDQREKQILSFKQDILQLSSPNKTKDIFQDATNIHEMYAQIVYKDSKIIELNNQILKHERQILDLKEHIKEKDEVLQCRNRAIQLMTADMNRKGKSVVDELDEVRQHMRLMQENFAIAEVEWKAEKRSFSQEMKKMKEEFEKDINEKHMKIKNSDETIRNFEIARHDLATKNAELQRKLVIVQEKADNHWKNFQNQIEGFGSVRQKFLCQIHKLQAMLNSMKQPVGEQGKENNVLNEKIVQLDVFRETELQELQDVICESDYFHTILNELQNKWSNIIEENAKLKLENELLKSALKSKEELLIEGSEQKQLFTVNNPDKLKISSSLEKCNSQQILLDDLFSLCMVKDLNEFREKYSDMTDTIKHLNCSVFEKNKEVESCKQQYEKMVAEVGKLQLDCQTANCELKNYSEQIQNLKVHINTQEKTYNDEINELKQYNENREKETLYLRDIASDREKLLQKAIANTEEKNELIRNLTENIRKQSSVMCQLEKQTVFLSAKIEILKETKKSDADGMQLKMLSTLEQISALEAEVSQLQAEVSSEVQRCADLEKESNDFKVLYEYLLEDQQACNTVSEDVKNQLESFQQQILLLESKLEKKHHEIECVQKTLKNKYEAEKGIMLQVNKDSIDSLEVALNVCQAEKEEMLKASISKELEIKELQTSLKELNQELDSEINKSSDIYHKYQCVSEEKKALSRQLLNVKYQMQSLKMEVSNLCVLLSEKSGIGKNMLCGNMMLEVQIFNENKNEMLLSVSDEAKLENTLLIKQNSDNPSQLELTKNDISAVDSNLHYIVSENETFEQTLAKCMEGLKFVTSVINHLRKKYGILWGENIILGQKNSDSVTLTRGDKQKIDKTNDKEMELLQLDILDEKLQQMERENSDMAKRVQDLQIVSQVVKEAELPFLIRKECHIVALQNEIEEPEKLNMSIKTETVAPLDRHSPTLNNLLSAKAEINEHKSNLENETKAKLCLQVSQHGVAGKHVRTAFLCTFQENKNWKSNLLKLKSDAQLELNQYSQGVIHVKNELSIVMDNIHQTEDEIMMLLKNSLSESAVFKETEGDLSGRLQNSYVLVQNLAGEKGMLQRLIVQLEQQADDLMLKLLVKEQYQLSLEKKQVEYEKQFFLFQKDIEHLTLLKPQYLFTIDKLLGLSKCMTDEIKESTVNEVPEMEFLENFHILEEDTIKSIENKFLNYERQTRMLSSNVNKLCDEKESLIKTSQAVQDENSSLLQRISYLEDVKDTMASILPALLKKFSDITKVNSASLRTVLDSINSKDVVLGRMEVSVMLLKGTLLVLKKKLKILESENVSLKDKIHCNDQDILHLQGITNNVLKGKNKTELQMEKQKMSKSLTDHTELLQSLVNWINLQGEKIRHLIDLLEMSSVENVLLFDKMNVENCKLQKQSEHSDAKAVEMVVTREEVLKSENPTTDHICFNNTECKEFESSRQWLYCIEKKIKELMNDASLNDSTIYELLQVHKTDEDVLPSLISTLKDFETSLHKLQYQIKKFSDKSNSYKCDLEFYIQEKNSLQVEAQNLHLSLSALEKEKLALKQEQKNTMYELQCIEMGYKEKINALQTEVNKYIKSNKELAEMVKEKSRLLINKQAEYGELQQIHISKSLKYNTAKEEPNALKSEFEREYKGKCSYCKESVDEDLKQNMEGMMKCKLEMKKHLKDICNMLYNKISYNPNLFSELDHPQELDYFSDDNYLEEAIIFLKSSISMIMKLLNEKQWKLQQVLSDLETVKEQKNDIVRTLNDKTHLCEELYLKVEELKKPQTEARTKIELSDNKAMVTKTGECFTQAPTFDVEGQFLMEKWQEGCIEKLCCNFESCQLANESLHHHINVQKDKMLTKLKISRHEVEELHDFIQRLKQENKKLTVSHDEFLRLQKKQLESHQKLEDDWKAAEKEKNCEIHRLQIIISELKGRNSLEISFDDQLQTQLQHYKDLWEQSNSTHELQKEENERLQLKVKKLFDEVEDVNLKMSELRNKCITSDAEKKYLQHTVEGLKENINMLISDNDTYQELIEKLSHSKASVEKDLAKLKENNPREMNKLNEKFLAEMNKMRSLLQVAEERKTELSDIEEQYMQLKSKHSLLEERKKCLESKVQDILKDKQLLENQNKELYGELCRQTDELHHLRMTNHEGTDISMYSEGMCSEKELESSINQFQDGEILEYNSFCEIPMSNELNQIVVSQHHIDDQNFNSIPVSSENTCVQGYSKSQVNELVKEKQALELQIKNLTDALESATIKKVAEVDEYLAKEKDCKTDSSRKELQQQITNLQMQLLDADNHAVGGGGIELGPISDSSVVETEFQQTINNLYQQDLRYEVFSLEASKLAEERNDLRLKLGHLHQHLCSTVSESGVVFGVDNSAGEEKLPSEDCQLLLGENDDNEHDVLADTNLFTTHHVKSSTWKFRRWIRSRRNYLCKAVPRKIFFQFLYVVYMFALHIWIILCTFGHT